MTYSEETLSRLKDHFVVVRSLGMLAEEMMMMEDGIKKSVAFTQDMIDNGTMEIHGGLFMDLLNGAIQMVEAHRSIMQVGERMGEVSVVQGNATVN